MYMLLLTTEFSVDVEYENKTSQITVNITRITFKTLVHKVRRAVDAEQIPLEQIRLQYKDSAGDLVPMGSEAAFLNCKEYFITDLQANGRPKKQPRRKSSTFFVSCTRTLSNTLTNQC